MKKTRIDIELDGREMAALKYAADEKGQSKRRAARDLVIKGLRDAGILKPPKTTEFLSRLK